MILRTALILSLAALSACAREKLAARATPAPTPAAAARRGVDLAAMDPTMKPGEDFYGYANGAFMRTAEIPPDRASTGAFLRVFETVEARTRAIVEEAARGDAPAGSDARKIGDLYSSFMDEPGIEAKGLEPLRPTLARIAALADARALAAELGGTVRADVDIFNCTNLTTSRPLGVWIEQDLNEPSRNTVYLVQGGLGLPDRDYYLDQSPRLAEHPRAVPRAPREGLRARRAPGPRAARGARADVRDEARRDPRLARGRWRRAEG